MTIAGTKNANTRTTIPAAIIACQNMLAKLIAGHAQVFTSYQWDLLLLEAGFLVGPGNFNGTLHLHV